MATFNLKQPTNIEEAYQSGLLPQRNSSHNFYQDSSCRSNLKNFKLSSENRRIINKTQRFHYIKQSQTEFDYNLSVQKKIHTWVKGLGWSFPTSSIRNVFSNHIFNQIYTWYDENNQVVAYSVCLETNKISHIAYVFYDPAYSHSDLPIRLILQYIIDSHELGLEFCYLGRFSQSTGYYKRNMPGFEYFENHQWLPFKK